MSYILFSFLFIALGAFFFYKRKLKQNKVEEMLASKNYSFEKIKADFENPSLGNDEYEIYGEVIVPSFLQAPLSGVDCVYYIVQIEREAEVKEEFTNQMGEKAFRWVGKTELVFEKEEYISFGIGDEGGGVQVDLKGSEITPDLSYSSHEKTELLGVPEVIKDNDLFISDLEQVREEEAALNTANIQVLGYRYREYTLPVHGKLYALGSVEKNEEKLVMAKAPEKPFLVSIKSPLDIYENLDQKIQVLFYAGAVCFVIALILVFYGAMGI